MGDYISREAAIKAIYASTVDTNPDHFTLDEYGKWQLHNGINIGITQAVLDVKSIPAADVVERKVGHWIFHPEQKNIYGGKLIECSECKTQYLVMNVVEEIYCRHCGSKNRNGGQDDV